MREIKIRGRNYDGIWMYGYLIPTPKPQIHLDNKHCVCACPQVMSKVDIVHYEVEENTIGQYTGLKDKNGKEIYEGDIMNDPTTKGVGVVEWNSVLCQFQLSWQNMPTAADIFFMVKCGSFVIGNIHDNPELIK